MAVRIRLFKLGRTHRPFYRIVAIDSRQPRDGRYLEELGSYDTSVRETDERVKLKPERVKHWLSVGAKPTENVAVLLKKYLGKFEELEKQQALTPATTAESQPTGEPVQA